MQPPRTTPSSPTEFLLAPSVTVLHHTFAPHAHASRSHLTYTTFTGLPYHLISGSRRLNRTNHSFRLLFDVRFLDLVHPPHLSFVYYPFSEGQLMLVLSSHDLYGSLIDRNFGAENYSLRTSFIANTSWCAGACGVYGAILGPFDPGFFYWRGGALCAGRVVEPLEVAGGKKAACLSDKRMDTLCREAYQSTYSSKRSSGLTAVQHVELTSSATTTRKFRSPSRSERTHTANSASTLHVTCTQLVQLT